MEKIDKIKGKTLYSSNGIKLVGADSGYCYIIDEEKKEILFKHFNEGYEIIKDRYIVLGGFDSDLILYDCEKKEFLIERCKYFGIKVSSDLFRSYCLPGIFVFKSSDGKKHIFDFNLIGTDKDCLNIGFDSIDLFYIDSDYNFQLALSDGDKISIYSKDEGIVPKNELQNYSLDKGVGTKSFPCRNIHILKNNSTGKKVLVMAKLNKETGEILYEFDSEELDDIYFMNYKVGLQPIRFNFVCLQRKNKLIICERKDWPRTINEVKNEENKLFEIDGSDINFLFQYEPYDYFDYELGATPKYISFFKYTKNNGNLGILIVESPSQYSLENSRLTLGNYIEIDGVCYTFYVNAIIEKGKIDVKKLLRVKSNGN